MSTKMEINSWEIINNAIEIYLNLGFMFKPKDKKTLTDEFGKEASNKVEEIYNFTTGFDVDWKIDNMESAKLKLEESLKQNYKGLNQESINILKRCFSYSWR